MGTAYLALCKREQAIEHYEKALDINPDLANAHYNLGITYVALGRREQAIAHYQEALCINPDNARVHYNLGNLFVELGNLGQAIDHYKKALIIKPDNDKVQNNLAWMLATVEDENLRDPAEAVQLANRVCELTQYAQPYYLDTLAVAYAAIGDFPRAIETAQKALRLAGDHEELLHKLQQRIELYKANKPYYDAQTD